MRAPRRLLALATLAALTACHRPAAGPTSTAHISAAPGPHLAAGLWEQRVSDRRGVSLTRYCLDAAGASALAAFDREQSGRCSRHDMARAADGSWHFSTACDMGAWGKVATEGVMQGDFQSHYVIEAHSQTVGASTPAANGPWRVKADVRRAGDCPKDMKPGDVILPNGARSRLDTLAGHA
jgi:hypothetical protein